MNSMAFYFIYLFLKIIFMWIIFKVFIEFVEILFLFSGFFFFFFFFLTTSHVGILAPWPGIESTSLALESDVLTTGLSGKYTISSVQFSSVAQLCPTLCDTMNRSTPGLPVHHQLPEFTQTHVHRVSDASQPSHPPSSSSPPALNPSQHQGLFK